MYQRFANFLAAGLFVLPLAASAQLSYTPAQPVLTDDATTAVAESRKLQVYTGSAMQYYQNLRNGKYKSLTLGAPKTTADDKAAFKPTVTVGTLMHVVAAGYQDEGSVDPAVDVEQKWRRQIHMYRTRLLFGGNVSPKTAWFIEVENPSVDGIGWNYADSTRNTQVSPIILDAQVEHKFSDAFSIIAGMQLVGINRNQLQGAASLLGVDFGYYQYQYTLTQKSPLQNNYGRDIGVNFRGLLANQKFEYRVGFFGGQAWDANGPLRTIVRLNYNFFEAETGQYYTGNSLGKNKYLAIGGGLDMQGGYMAYGLDLFLDMPLGDFGSVVANTSYSMLNGGDPANPYNLGLQIPKQSILFAEAGLYIKSIKMEPFVQVEMLNMDGDKAQLGLPETATGAMVDDANELRSISRFGGGLCWLFNDYNTNLKISYTVNNRNASYVNTDGDTVIDGLSRGVIWAQLQLFFF